MSTASTTGVSPGYGFIVVVAVAAVRPAPSMRVYG
jgi:hypothetical protein